MVKKFLLLLLLSLGFASAQWTEDLSTDLIGFYKFNETSGTNVLNSYTETNDATASTENVFNTTASGIFGTAADLTVLSTDYVDVSSLITNINESWTMSFWLNNSNNNSVESDIFFDASSPRFYASWAGTDSGRGWLISDGGTNVFVGNLTSYVNEWAHIVITHNDTTGTIFFYINGDEIYSGTGLGNSDMSGTAYVGRRVSNPSDSYDGLIDEVGFWERQLTQAEVGELYNGGTGITYMAIEPSDNSPTPTINLPIVAYNTSSTTVTFNYSCADDFLIENMTLYIDDEAVNVTANGTDNETFLEYDYTVGSDGAYSWHVGCFDNATQQTNSSSRTFTVDTTDPIINITFPANTTYGTSPTTINYSLIETNSPNTCFYSTDGGEINSSTNACLNFTGLTASEGPNSWTVYALDFVTNLGFSIINFILDTTGPIFTDFDNLTINNNNSVEYDINASDLYSSIDVFAINNTGNFSINATSGLLINSTGLEISLYILNVSLNDSLGNLASELLYINYTGIFVNESEEVVVSGGGGSGPVEDEEEKKEEGGIWDYIKKVVNNPTDNWQFILIFAILVYMVASPKRQKKSK